jgi:FtsZ-interacting cell division protein YlmF
MSNIENAVEKLLKIACDLEKEAEENTYFVCLDCNHTATLADINKKRKTAAKELNIKAPKVTVNDVVKCFACNGKMMYLPTEDSEKYYIEASEDDDKKVKIENEDESEIKENKDKENFDDIEKEQEKEEKQEEEEQKQEQEQEQEQENKTLDKGVVEEIVTDEKKDTEDKKKEKDLVKIPKKEPPKFEKMPEKDACIKEQDFMGEDFWNAVKKYDIF